MKKILLLALSLVLCGAGRAAAQPEPSASHMAAAVELLESMNIADALQLSINTMLEVQMQANPDMRQLEDVMREFFAKYMSWESLKDGYARIYANTFTENELRQITTFYRTPVGQKVARSMPQLMAEGAKLGERAVTDHQMELQQMILRRLEQGSGTSRP